MGRFHFPPKFIFFPQKKVGFHFPPNYFRLTLYLFSSNILGSIEVYFIPVIPNDNRMKHYVDYLTDTCILKNATFSLLI